MTDAKRLSDLLSNREFRQWFDSRPEAVREAVLKKPPGDYKYLGEDGEYHSAVYTIVAYEEGLDGTCTTARVYTEGAFDLLPREVFGMELERLHPVEE